MYLERGHVRWAVRDCELGAREGIEPGDSPRYIDQYTMLLGAGHNAAFSVASNFAYRLEHWIATPDGPVMVGDLPFAAAGQERVYGLFPEVSGPHTLVLVAINPGQTGDYVMAFGDYFESQREALVTLYNNTDGDNWTISTDWLGAPGTECNWYGVTCIDGVVSAVELPDNGLAGTLPEQLQLLTELRTLNLSDNGLTGAIPPQLANVDVLETLLLQNNQLTGTVSQTAMVTSLNNVANVFTAMSSRTRELSSSQQQTVQTLATSTVTSSASLIKSTSTTSELVQVVAAVSSVINAASKAGASPSTELVGQAQSLTSKAISTGLNQFSAGVDVTDPVQVANVLRTNPDALAFALEASVVLNSTVTADTTAVQSELAELGISQEDSLRLSTNVVGSVANTDGVNVGGGSATDALISALARLLAGSAQGLSEPAAGLALHALAQSGANVTVNQATGVMEITLPGQRIHGVALNIKLVPDSVPPGV